MCANHNAVIHEAWLPWLLAVITTLERPRSMYVGYRKTGCSGYMIVKYMMTTIGCYKKHGFQIQYMITTIRCLRSMVARYMITTIGCSRSMVADRKMTIVW